MKFGHAGDEDDTTGVVRLSLGCYHRNHILDDNSCLLLLDNSKLLELYCICSRTFHYFVYSMGLYKLLD